MILWVILFYLGNLLDILSTYWSMRGLPKEKMQEKELNPIMSRFIHNRKASYTFKFGLTTLIAVLVILNPSMLVFLKLFTLMFFFIVLNNTLAHYLTKKGKLSPGKFLTQKLRFPKFLAYLTILAICLFASLEVYLLL